jgi:intraflagellar transport protein 172
VWYNIEDPDKVTVYNIRGDVEDIERSEGRTEVIVNEGVNMVNYALDEPLIEFGFAIESRNLERAVEILTPLDMTPECEAHWNALAKLSIEEQNLTVAEQCYSALGDVAKARFIHKVNKLAERHKQETG